MRLWIFSDLHIESCQWDLPIDHPEHDVIVAAGDILTPCSAAVAWLGERARERPLAKHYGRFLPENKASLAAEILNRVWSTS